MQHEGRPAPWHKCHSGALHNRPQESVGSVERPPGFGPSGRDLCGEAIVRKGGKHVIIPLAPRTGGTLDLNIDEGTAGYSALCRPWLIMLTVTWLVRRRAGRTFQGRRSPCGGRSGTHRGCLEGRVVAAEATPLRDCRPGERLSVTTAAMLGWRGHVVATPGRPVLPPCSGWCSGCCSARHVAQPPVQSLVQSRQPVRRPELDSDIGHRPATTADLDRDPPEASAGRVVEVLLPVPPEEE